jgi:hypothetical protein
MNIFYFHSDPKICAQQHCNSHAVKMCVEYSQILSTAHRILDGEQTAVKSKSGRNQKVWILPDARDGILYKATHVNHPSNKWVRNSVENYQWLFSLFVELLAEYKYRYGRDHACSALVESLRWAPNNIPASGFSHPWRAMPDQYKVDKSDSMYCQKSYQSYFSGEKQHIAKWTGRELPEWFKEEN